LACEIAQEDCGTFQDADENHGLPGEVASDFRAQLFDSCINLLTGEEDFKGQHGTHIKQNFGARDRKMRNQLVAGSRQSLARIVLACFGSKMSAATEYRTLSFPRVIELVKA
jgi:hypothetical protein